jgi:ribosome-associated protein
MPGWRDHGGSVRRAGSLRLMTDVPIRGDMIRLGQLLKLSGLADDGVHAKEMLKSVRVTVNGEVDNRRGRQLFPGDVVVVGRDELTVTVAE